MRSFSEAVNAESDTEPSGIGSHVFAAGFSGYLEDALYIAREPRDAARSTQELHFDTYR